MASIVHRAPVSDRPTLLSRPGGLARSRARIAWLLLLPLLIVHAIVIVGPAISAFYYSLTKWSGFGDATFVGLDNYRRLIFDDPAVARALLNNLIWMVFFLTVPFALALVAAALIAPLRRFGLVVRLLFFVPYVLPAVVVAQIWRYLLSPVHGVGAQLAAAGLGGFDIALLGNAGTVLLTVAFVDNWHWWGFLTVVFLAAMQGIPKDTYEAARIEGASSWQEFVHVTLPGISSTIVFMLLMSAIWSFLVFEYVWILTQGGPAGASEVLGTLVVKNAFYRFDAGYGAAIGLAMSVLAGIVVTVYLVMRRRGYEL